MTYIQINYDYNSLLIVLKSKTVTLYAGLTYHFRGNGFKREKANWKISNTSCATIKGDRYGAAAVTTKKAGNFVITAKQGNKKYTYKVTVKEDLSKRYTFVKLSGNKLTWNKVPGATGYLVYRQYYQEGAVDFSGWKDGDKVKLADLQGNSKTSYTITEPNWKELRKSNWGYRVRPYKKSGNKIIFTSEYPEDMTFNTVNLK